MWKALVLAAGLGFAALSAQAAIPTGNETKAAIAQKADGSYQEARTHVRSHYRRTKSGHRTRVRSHYRRR